jgi:hypothetical protein
MAYCTLALANALLKQQWNCMGILSASHPGLLETQILTHYVCPGVLFGIQ